MNISNFIPSMTPAVRLLIIVNLVVYVLHVFQIIPYGLLGLYNLNHPNFMVYQMLSSVFVHHELWHIAFNMMSLFSLGMVLESRWGSRRFLWFYLICGFGGSLVQIAINYVLLTYFQIDSSLYSIGASGAVFGVFTALALKYPDMEFMLFLIPFPIKAKYLWRGLVAIDFFFGLARVEGDIIGHWAHLGGVLFGYILLRFVYRERLDSWI